MRFIISSHLIKGLIFEKIIDNPFSTSLPKFEASFIKVKPTPLKLFNYIHDLLPPKDVVIDSVTSGNNLNYPEPQCNLSSVILIAFKHLMILINTSILLKKVLFLPFNFKLHPLTSGIIF